VHGAFSTAADAVAAAVSAQLALEDRVQTLDGGDRHPRDGVDHVRGQVLNVVQLGKLATIVRRDATAHA
jgi:hypothetical protein